jgi:hypothetical protein
MKKTILLLIILASAQLIYAWPGGSGGGTAGPGQNTASGTSGTDNNDLVPIDGGVVTMTALAIGYGVRQARQRKEEKNNDNGAV